MNALKRTAITAIVGLTAALVMAGCSSASPEDSAKQLAADFVTWAVEDATATSGVDSIAKAVKEHPFPGEICDGAEERAYAQLSWMQPADELGEVTLAKAEEGGTFYFVVKTTSDKGKVSALDMPVRVKTVDGQQCIDGAGESAKLRS